MMSATIDRLAIVVVYLVEEEDDDLLDLHLSEIAANTGVPYRIYGSVARLAPGFRPRLRAAGVRLCDVTPTELRGYREHAYYLDHLIDRAIADGASHVVTLNVDSFPIVPGWAERLAAGLDDDRPLAAVRRDENRDAKPHPCCMFFGRGFYQAHRPSMLMTAEQRESAAGRAYIASGAVVDDTGIGYGYALAAAGRAWLPLLRSNVGSDHYIIGSVYGDMVFHLGGATRTLKIHVDERNALDASPRSRAVRAAAAAAAKVLPARVRRLLSPLKLYAISPTAKRRLDAGEWAYRRARERLRRDPAAYFEYLRHGRRETAAP